MNMITLEDAEAEARWGPSADGPPSRTLPTFLASDLAGSPIPPREWHVPEMIPARNVTFLYADGAVGKSLLLMQLMASTAMGAQWIGLHTKSGRCLYYCAEDDADEVHRRLADICEAEGFDLAGMTNLRVIPIAGEDGILAAPTKKGGLLEPTSLWAALEVEVLHWQPTLVVIDTLADSFGGDEIQKVHARAFVSMLRGLAFRSGAAVVVAAHPSMSGMSTGSGMSGNVAWNNSVRSRMYLRRIVDEDGLEPDPDARVLTTKKLNYGRSGGEMRLRWVRGVFVPMDEPAVASMTNMASEARAERIFLEMLDRYNGDGRSVSATPGSNYAPLIFSRDPSAGGLTKKALTSAMNYLFKARQIVLAEYGPPSKLRKRIERPGVGE